MKSKFYVTFLNHITNFESDIELVDVLNISITKNRLNDQSSDKMLFDINETQHPVLANKMNNDKNRILSVRHLKATLYISIIKELYEETTLYLRHILQTAAINGFNPGRLVGENNNITFTANEILSTSNWEQIAERVADTIFKRLEEERSTLTLIKKMDKKLGLDIPDTTINRALPYLQIRHYLVHADGFVDDDFKKKYPNISVNSDNKIELNFEIVMEAKKAINNLVRVIDRHCIKKGFIPESYQSR